MSGYRTLHRLKPTTTTTSSSSTNQEIIQHQQQPIWSIQFSPCTQCRGERNSNTNTNPTSTLRLVTSSADGILRAYSITEKTNNNNTINNNSILDATALTIRQTHELLSSSSSSSHSSAKVSLGSAALSIIRNHVGEDPNSGDEIIASLRLDGYISFWVREEQPLYYSTTGNNNNSRGVEEDDDAPIPTILHQKGFHFPLGVGTTIVLIPPQITGFSKYGIIMLIGCLDGSIALVSTGFSIAGSTTTTASSGGGASGNDEKMTPQMGNVFDKVGVSNSIPMSIALCPCHSITFAVGRKNGVVDIYSNHVNNDKNNNTSAGGNRSLSLPALSGFHRIHHLTHHAGSIVRALKYTPDGALLISGDDNGSIYIHDVSSYPMMNSSIRLVAAIINAHKGYILSIDVMPDSKRFVTCSADGKLKVWDVAAPNSGPLHTFDTGHVGMIWDVNVSADGKFCVSCGDDGMLQIYSCQES